MDAMQVLQITLGLQVMQLMAWLYIVYLLRGKQPKRKKQDYDQTVKRVPDWSEPGMHPTPAAVLDMEKPFAKLLVGRAEIEWAEEKLYPIFQTAGGTSKARMRDVLRKWEGDGILKRKGNAGNNSRTFDVGGWKKLCAVASPPPSASTPKTGKKTG